MKTVLVTGVAGFIGSNLCLSLLSEGSRIVGIDNFVSGSQKNVEDLEKNKNFSFLKHDVCCPLKLQTKIDEVWNLACPASPVDFAKHPTEILLTCSLGVKNVLDFACLHKARFLHSSTSEIYGDPKVHPQKEDYWGNVNPIGMRSCYDEGKRFAESLIVNYGRVKGLDAKIVRIFNTYGPRMRADDGRVISNFIIQALKGNDITIYGDGLQTRSFCYVDDMVDGLIKMMASCEHGPINLGNPLEFSIKSLAELLLKLTRSDSTIIYNALPQDDPKQRRPDISLAKERLGWEPKIDLKEGLERTIDFFRETS